MVKEKYLWLAFAIVIIAGAIYFRFYYQPQLSLTVALPSQSVSIYPYQAVSIPITISDTGSSQLSNLSFGLYVNGNVTRVYKATIPSGKQATVYYNFTPTTYGTYNISVVADPSDLYNIANRQTTKAEITIVALQAQKAQPYMGFNSVGLIGEDSFNMTSGGFAVETYMLNNFSAQRFALTGSSLVNDFIYPALDVYSSYISQIAVAHAYYNNTYLASIWIQGYLTPQAIDEAAVGKNLNVTTQGNLTFINFGSNTTLCSWYSGGWIKNMVVVGANRICTNYISMEGNYSGASELYNKLVYRNVSLLNYSGYYGNLSFAGDISVLNQSFVYESLEKEGNFSNVCYGDILDVNNNSYCSTYLLGSGNFVISQNERLVGAYNLSVWALTNSSDIGNGTQVALAVAQKYNLTGQKFNFTSAYANTCFVDVDIPCKNATFGYNGLGVSLMNNLNYSITLTGVKCFTGTSSTNVTALDTAIASGGTETITMPCYTNGTVLSGVPIGLGLYLTLYYTASSQNVTSNGYAYIV